MSYLDGCPSCKFTGSHWWNNTVHNLRGFLNRMTQDDPSSEKGGMQPNNPGEIFLQDVCRQEVTLSFIVLVTAWARGGVGNLWIEMFWNNHLQMQIQTRKQKETIFGNSEESIVSIISLVALVIASRYKTCHVEKKTITGVHLDL